MKKKIPHSIIARIGFIVILAFVSTSAYAQAPAYSGPLMYATQFDTSVPPIYVGMPPAVTTAYLWFDEAMRLNKKSQVLNYIGRMSWDDTAQFIASNLYQIHDYDPLALWNWSGHWVHPDPYKCEPGDAQEPFESEIKNLLGYRTYLLLTTDIISDVLVTDTICPKVQLGTGLGGTSYSYIDVDLVHSSILDEIKGQNIPSCDGYLLKSRKKGALPQSTSPIWTYSVPADTGSCLQFEYPLEKLHEDGTVDSSWAMTPGKEYIVFLSFSGIGLDSASGYFTVLPGPTFPVISGIVQDPNDYFGFGSTGLTVAAWKAKLRALIYGIVHP